MWYGRVLRVFCPPNENSVPHAEVVERAATGGFSMAFFVVTYDLRKKGEFDYQPLWDELSHMDAVKFQESNYFLSTESTREKIKNHLKQFIHEHDLLMVVEFYTKPDYTKALKGTNDWVNTHWP